MTTDLSAAEVELDRHVWDTPDVPEAVRLLLAADNEDDLLLARSELADGGSAAELASVWCAALTDPLHPLARRAVLELLSRTVSDQPRAQATAREAIWPLYAELFAGSDDAGRVLDAIEPDRDRYHHLRAKAGQTTLPLAELERHDWTQLKACATNASRVPAAVHQLLAGNVDDADDELEDYLIVQGNVMPAGVSLVPVIAAALTVQESAPPRWPTINLLLQLMTIDLDARHIEPGSVEDRARAAAREAIWLLYGDLCHGESEWADDILTVIDPDRERYRFFRARAESAGRELSALAAKRLGS